MKPLPNMVSFHSTQHLPHHRSKPTTTIIMPQPPRRRASVSAIQSTNSPIRAPAKARWTASTIFQLLKQFWPQRSFASKKQRRVSHTKWSISWRRELARPVDLETSKRDWSPDGVLRMPSIRIWCRLRWLTVWHCRCIRESRRRLFPAI